MCRAIVVSWGVVGIAALVGIGCGQPSAPTASDESKSQDAPTEATARSRAVDGAAKEANEEPTGEKPKPEEILRQMADYLGELPAFSGKVSIATRIEAIDADRTSVSNVSVRLARPNRLALFVESGSTHVAVVSDGKKLTQYYSPLKGYTVKDAPTDLSAIRETEAGAMLSGLGELLPTSGEELYRSITAGVTGSEYVGKVKLGDVECHHLRFVNEDFDWEIWIEAWDRPVPLKVVPDMTRRLAGQPGMDDVKVENIITFSEWDVSPKFSATDFEFRAPAGARKVASLFEEPPHPLLGEAAPAFETVDLEGKPIELAAALGKNVILLDFWATWCIPCIEAMPEIDAVAEKFADQGLVFYGMNVGEDVETIKPFLEANMLDVPVAMDPEGEIGGLYKVTGIPQTVLIGKDGRVQVVHIGFGRNLTSELTGEIEDLLAGKDLASEVLGEGEGAEGEVEAADEPASGAEEATESTDAAAAE